MRLISASVQGFRRFADETTVRLSEPLIAVVGSNEAGKSSFLSALTALNDAEPVDQRDRTRRADIPLRITATFELEDGDRENMHGIPGADVIAKCTFVKRNDGPIRVALDPSPPHNLNPRRQVEGHWGEVADGLSPSGNKDEVKAKKRLLVEVPTALSSEKEFVGEEAISVLESAAEWLREEAEVRDQEEDDESPYSKVAQMLEDLVSHERECAPARARRAVLVDRPQMLLFSDEARDLRATYQLGTESEDRPKALVNVARLAGLDLDKLNQAASQGDIPHVRELMQSANSALADIFSRSWIRDDVVPELGCEGSVLHLMVRSPDNVGLSWIDERSDGLRWFIALLAFLNAEASSQTPVLLVDEAESHLSYDAQASLIDVLEGQRLTRTVIYTTHSAGCLPSDLGTGIRPVLPLGGERSKLENCFWALGEGFSPLLLAMGLTPLAFTAARNQLVGEGASECLLLPTLLRQATSEVQLGYQVAPGAANIAPEQLPDLIAESGHVAFLLDGDEAGVGRAQFIREHAGLEADRVATYADFGGHGLVFEDLLDPTAYVKAVNRELRRWQQAEVELSVEVLPDVNRPAAVKTWCVSQGLNEVSKATLCQTLAEMGATGNRVVSEGHVDLLVDAHSWAVDRLPPPRFTPSAQGR